MSYRNQFDQYLRDVVRGRDEMVRRTLFMEWARSQAFVCEGCLEEFTPDPEGLDEDAVVHCSECVAWKRGYERGLRSARGGRR